ncbi:hypothetical protein Rsub_11743 [Raphidocelis subcapitata]|uniref:Uncharacterized protein n=1 Tax=Raphidocelis subcapitata TaxID=307507 RepID=A0A2V0PHP3_9CHLO|nr:hypothetical protein Rsub_11743 [Raphidocelis subcapitata]|eukprot:GBF99331.1 hypothetical protein Rsub_11743 [Raphidocelis subcapitata]
MSGAEPSTPAVCRSAACRLADAAPRSHSPGGPPSVDGKARPQWVNSFSASKKGLFSTPERGAAAATATPAAPRSSSPAPSRASSCRSIDSRPEWDPFFARGGQDAAPRSAKALSRQHSRRSSLGERDEARGQQQHRPAPHAAAAGAAPAAQRLVLPRPPPPTSAAAPQPSAAEAEPAACSGDGSDSGTAKACDCSQADLFASIFERLGRLEDSARQLLLLAHCARGPKFASCGEDSGGGVDGGSGGGEAQQRSQQQQGETRQAAEERHRQPAATVAAAAAVAAS